MSSTGYIQVHAYTSNAQIPLNDAAVTITDSSGAGIAMRLTNRSGLLDEAIAITVPDISASQTPQSSTPPFTAVDLYARLENYEEVSVNGLQVFANTVTLQNLEMIPLSELPAQWNQAEVFDTPPQNL